MMYSKDKQMSNKEDRVDSQRRKREIAIKKADKVKNKWEKWQRKDVVELEQRSLTPTAPTKITRSTWRAQFWHTGRRTCSPLTPTRVWNTLVHDKFSSVVCVHCGGRKDPALVTRGFPIQILDLLQGSAHLQHRAFVRLLISNSLSGSCSAAAVCLYACALPTQFELTCILKHNRTNSFGRYALIMGLFSCSVQWCGAIIALPVTFGTSFCWLSACMACVKCIIVQ